MNGHQGDMQTTPAVNLKPFSLPSLPGISIIAYAQLVYYTESPNFMKILWSCGLKCWVWGSAVLKWEAEKQDRRKGRVSKSHDTTPTR